MSRARKDNNHNAIVSRFKDLGCSVAELIDTGIPGWPDLVVGVISFNHLVECKNPETAYGRRGLNANQTTFNRDWRGEKVWICAGIDEATALVMNWRKRDS